MKKYHKGIESRAAILTGARQILNEQGLGLTVDMLAKKMGLTRGKITNYFPTKDTLLLNIMKEYEQKLSLILESFEWGNGPSLDNMLKVNSIIMDVQYEYRCAIAYIATVSIYQEELHQHIEQSFNKRVGELKMLLSAMVALNILKHEILNAPDFQVFCFQYTNLLTTWVISQQLYFGSRTYSEMKFYYLKGFMTLFTPFLTPMGKRDFLKLDYGISA